MTMRHLDTIPIYPSEQTPKNPFNGLVSIIIPSYNCAATIPRSIESLQTQTYGNMEIIVVDDASDDNGATKKAVTSYPTRYICLEKNSGAAVARNTGAKIAKGAILMFAEADGYYDNDYVEKIIRYMHLPAVVAGINLGRKVWTDKDTPLVRHQNDIFAAAVDRIKKGKRGAGAWAFHKESFWAVGGYDPTCHIGQDMDLVRRVIKAGGKTVAGGFSTLHHKDPDTLRKYWKRAFRGGLFSGRFQEKWRGNDFPFQKLKYLLKFAFMAMAPLYFLAAFFWPFPFFPLFLIVVGYLLFEDPTTTNGWITGLKKGDISTFLLTPAFLYIRRLAIGWGRVKSFFTKKA